MDINRNFHFQCCNRISTDIRRFAIAKCEPGLKSTWSSLPTVPCLARLRWRLFALDSNYSARSELQEYEALYPHRRINRNFFLDFANSRFVLPYPTQRQVAIRLAITTGSYLSSATTMTI
jgi:hypothetical protein